MTAVINLAIRAAFPLTGNSWLVNSRVKENRPALRPAILQRKKWVPQLVNRQPPVTLERFSVVSPDGTIKDVHTSEDSYLTFNTNNKGWIVRDAITNGSELTQSVVWEEKPAKRRKMVDLEDMKLPNFQRYEDYVALAYNDVRYLLGNYRESGYEYDSYSYRRIHIHELIPSKVIKSILDHIKERSNNKLLILNLASGDGKTVECPFSIKDSCFSDDGQTLLVYGNKQFFIIDQPI